MDDRGQCTQPGFMVPIVLLAYIGLLIYVTGGIFDPSIRQVDTGMYWLSVGLVLLPVGVNIYSYLTGQKQNDDPQKRLSDYENDTN